MADGINKAEKIRDLSIAARGLKTKADLAVALKLDPATITKWEACQMSRLSSKTRLRLAKYLQLPDADMITAYLNGQLTLSQVTSRVDPLISLPAPELEELTLAQIIRWVYNQDNEQIASLIEQAGRILRDRSHSWGFWQLLEKWEDEAGLVGSELTRKAKDIGIDVDRLTAIINGQMPTWKEVESIAGEITKPGYPGDHHWTPYELWEIAESSQAEQSEASASS